MAYDLLKIEDDIYEYHITEGTATGEKNCVPLTGEDPLWAQLRHEHIANVAKIIQSKIETDTLMDKTSTVRRKGLPGLSATIKHFIVGKKNETFYSYRHMANECMKIYCGGVNITSQLEQNLAMGTTAEGRPTGNPLANVLNILEDNEYEMDRKLRILLLYIFHLKGISKQAFDDIIKKANIPFSSAYIISNVLHLDIDLFRPGKCIPIDKSGIEESEVLDPVYKQSRWKPLIKDLMLTCVKGKLSEDHFPFLNECDADRIATVQRTGYWCVDKKSEHNSQLVIFIAGGVTFSEVCCVYEVMKQYSGWDIYIGGDCILTPTKFIEKLAELPCLITESI